MEQLAWSDALMTGIDVIDRQHRGLVDMVNATAKRLVGDDELGAEEVRALVGYLKDYAEVHFGTEEALMALCELSPGYAQDHHRKHSRFLSHVDDMLDQLSERAVPDGRQLLRFLGRWLIGHIQGEDQGLARKLRAAQKGATRELGDLAAAGSTAGPSSAIAVAPAFDLALAQGTATLHASEEDVLALIDKDANAAVVITLDVSLLPGVIVHANAVAANFFGSDPEGLQDRSSAALFSAAQIQRLPIVMSQVLMSGRFEGLIECVGTDGVARPVSARITHLVLHGRMAILIVFSVPAASANAFAATGPAHVPGGRVQSDETILALHPLFQDLARDELGMLEGVAKLIRLSKGQTLFQKGDEPAGLFMLVSGQISLVASNSRNEERVLDIVDPPGVLGDVEIFARRPSSVTAQSLAPSVLLLIPADMLRGLHLSSVAFAAAAATHLGMKLYRSTARIEALTLHTALERIIDHLLEHARPVDDGGVEAVLPAQKQVIASYLDINPSSLSRAFQLLAEKGLLTISGRYVHILDPAGLVRLRAQGAIG
ncbi:hemerythrin domain-containing protein [Rhodocyclaceae bacterium SMB388]